MNQADARWQAEQLAGETFVENTGRDFHGGVRKVFRDGWQAGRDWALEEFKRRLDDDKRD